MKEFKETPANIRSISKRKLVCGMGINDATYQVQKRVNGKQVVCPYYTKWVSMFQRCYSEKYHLTRPTYIGCSVCIEWLTFSTFKSWMIKQDWKGNHLDKDLLFQGNKIYSPEFCLFVSPHINLLLNKCKAKRGKYPRGVSFFKFSGKYQSHVSINGKHKHLGYYDTVEQAHDIYKKEKYEIIKALALTESEPLKSALLNYKIGDDHESS